MMLFSSFGLGKMSFETGETCNNKDYLSFCFTTDNVRKIRHVRCMETSDIYARI